MPGSRQAPGSRLQKRSERYYLEFRPDPRHPRVSTGRQTPMCGIAGWLLEDPLCGVADLQRMLEAISHRGPDDRGTHIDEDSGLALGHNRLSIIDLTPGGHQPMTNPGNGDVLTFNGEIYNYRELRRRLEAEGHRFRSESDTEVLLYAFAAWGTECVRHVRGMYAFALWRPTDRALFLFRDP